MPRKGIQYVSINHSARAPGRLTMFVTRKLTSHTLEQQRKNLHSGHFRMVTDSISKILEHARSSDRRRVIRLRTKKQSRKTILTISVPPKDYVVDGYTCAHKGSPRSYFVNNMLSIFIKNLRCKTSLHQPYETFIGVRKSRLKVHR